MVADDEYELAIVGPFDMVDAAVVVVVVFRTATLPMPSAIETVAITMSSNLIWLLRMVI